MNKHRTGNREQRTEVLKQFLQNALPPVDPDPDSSQDLWPAMQRRLRAQPNPWATKVSVPWLPVPGLRVPGLRVPWFDWALAGGLALLLAAFPAWIPVVLYYL